MGSVTIRVVGSSTRPVATRDTSWRDRAACRLLDQNIFFVDTGDAAGVERAQTVCEACGVRSDCLSYAVGTNQTEGIWGGTTPAERRRIRRQWMRKLKEAG